jgi:hypothetical protein
MCEGERDAFTCVVTSRMRPPGGSVRRPPPHIRVPHLGGLGGPGPLVLGQKLSAHVAWRRRPTLGIVVVVEVVLGRRRRRRMKRVGCHCEPLAGYYFSPRQLPRSRRRRRCVAALWCGTSAAMATYAAHCTRDPTVYPHIRLCRAAVWRSLPRRLHPDRVSRL